MMKQASHPAYWQFDLFLFAIVALALLIMRTHLPAIWEVVAEWGWSALTIGGMGLWVRLNWAALCREDQEHPQ